MGFPPDESAGSLSALPLSLNIGEGGDILQPMAVGAIGGLGMEMAVALFLMPCF